MKKLLTIVSILTFFSTFSLKAQTQGTLTLTFTQTAASSQATKNVLAVWIQDANGTFVKTRMRFWGSGTNDHLPTWKANSSQNIVDAVTGATLKSTTTPTAFGTKTVTWDGTNVSGNIVPDGIYKIVIESAWANPEPANNQHNVISTFTFIKADSNTFITPTDANFSNISINWVPSGGVSINEKSDTSLKVSVFPNPSKGIFELEFGSTTNISKVQVYNSTGATVFVDSQKKENLVIESIDISNQPNGIYIIELFLENGSSLKKTVIVDDLSSK